MERKGKGKEGKGTGKGRKFKGNKKEMKGEREIESRFSTTKLGKEVFKGIERELMGKLGLGNA